MDLLELKKRRKKDILNKFNRQYELQAQTEMLLLATSNPTEQARLEIDVSNKQSSTQKSEAELETLEQEIDRLMQKLNQKNLERFEPPLKVAVSRAYKELPTTAPVGQGDEVSFDYSVFGEVKVEAGELEALISTRSRYLDALLYADGLRKSIAGIGRVELNGEAFGTAFLVAKNKVLTNWHVVRDPKYLDKLTVRFGHYFSSLEKLEQGQVFKVSKLLAWKEVKVLDYALLELEGDPTSEGKFQVLSPSTIEPLEERVVNILHHPNGQPLKLSTQDNWVKKVQGDRVLYMTNTEKGSSGSPVFNDNWELVALHHSSSPVPPTNFPGNIEANEGIVMRYILDDLNREGIKF